MLIETRRSALLPNTGITESTNAVDFCGELLIEISQRQRPETHDQSGINADRCPESNPLETALQAVASPSCSSAEIERVSSPGVEPGLRPSQCRVHPPHSKDLMRIARQGVEPCLAVSKTTVQSTTLTSYRIHCFPAICFIIGSSGSSKGRRLDSHQHDSPQRNRTPQGGRLSQPSHVGSSQPSLQHKRDDSNRAPPDRVVGVSFGG